MVVWLTPRSVASEAPVFRAERASVRMDWSWLCTSPNRPSAVRKRLREVWVLKMVRERPSVWALRFSLTTRPAGSSAALLMRLAVERRSRLR